MPLRTVASMTLLEVGGLSLIYGPGGDAVEQVGSNGVVEFLHHDSLGSIRLITNTTGVPVGSASYTPFGRRVSELLVTGSGDGQPQQWVDEYNATQGATHGYICYVETDSQQALSEFGDETGQLQPDQAGDSAASCGVYGTAGSPLGYAGQYTDPTTGFTYNQARWYDPGTGSFLTSDPDLEQTEEAYSYADDNPLLFTDPDGENFLQDLDDVVKIVKAAPKKVVKAAKTVAKTTAGATKAVVKEAAKITSAIAGPTSTVLGGASVACAVVTTPADPLCDLGAGASVAIGAAGTAADSYLAAADKESGLAVPLDGEATGLGGLGYLAARGDPEAGLVFGITGVGASGLAWVASYFDKEFGGH